MCKRVLDIVHIDDVCSLTNSCRHNVKVLCNDGSVVPATLSSDGIWAILKNTKSLPEWHDHFLLKTQSLEKENPALC